MSVSVQAPVPIAQTAPKYHTHPATPSPETLTTVLQTVDTIIPAAIALALDEVGARSITLEVADTDAEPSCTIAHIGALFPSSLKGVSFRGPVDPTTLAALDELPPLSDTLNTNLTTSPSTTSPPPSSFLVTDRIGQGAIWNAFTVQLADGSVAVLKVTCMSAYVACDGDWEEGTEVRKYVVQDVRAHLALDDLSCTPKMLGVWAGLDAEGLEYWALLEEHAGEPVVVDALSEEQRQAILEAYAELHTRGVMHNDVKPIHWFLQPTTGNVMVIDFSHAIDLTTLGCDHRRMLCLSEMGDVREHLGVEESGWTAAPYSLAASRVGSPAGSVKRSLS